MKRALHLCWTLGLSGILGAGPYLQDRIQPIHPQNRKVVKVTPAEKALAGEPKVVEGNRIGTVPPGYHPLHAGGPDGFGYTFIDSDEPGGPTFEWIDITGTGQLISLPDDGFATVDLSFFFPFYNTRYSSIDIQSNGTITFHHQYFGYINEALPTNRYSGPWDLIAFYWSDQNPASSIAGGVYFQDFGTYAVVEFYQIPEYGDTTTNTYEVILYANGDIRINFLEVTAYSDETIGIQDASAYPSGDWFLQYTYNGDPVIPHDSLSILFTYPSYDYDVGVVTILSPVGTYTLGEVLSTAIVVANSGNNDAVFDAHFQIYDPQGSLVFDEVAQSVSLAAGEVDTLSFSDFTPAIGGVYQVTAFTVWADDQNPINDTARGTFTVIEGLINFEADNGGFMALTGMWEWGTPTTGPGGAWSGVNVWATALDTTYGNMANWQLLSAPFVVTSANATIGFMHWYNIESYWDGGNVKMSTDFGNTWTIIEPIGGYPEDAVSGSNAGIPGEPAFSGNSGGWVQALFDLTGLVNPGDTVFFLFHFGSDASVTRDGWYIDDFTFMGLQQITLNADVGLDQALAPLLLHSPGEVVTPQVVVTNYGDLSASFNGHLRITEAGNEVYHEIVPFSLEPGQTDTITFPDWAIPDTTDTFRVRFWQDYAMDQNADNDVIEYVVTVLAPAGPDLDSTDGGFQANIPNTWEWGIPTSGPGGAYTGTHVWATNLEGNYENNADWQLVTPPFLISEDAPYFSFWTWYSIESYWDGGNVKMSTDFGNTWTIIEPIGGYPEDAVSGSNAGIPGEPAFSGNSGGWVFVAFDLASYGVGPGDMVQFKFHFGSDGSVTYPGWYIDDPQIWGGIASVPRDVAVQGASIAPGDSLPGGVAFTPYAVIGNSLVGPEADFRVFFKVLRGGYTVYSAFADVINLAPAAVETVYFSPDWVPTEPGLYTLQVTVQKPDDPVTGNNVYTAEFEVLMPLENLERVDEGTPKVFALGPLFPNPTVGGPVEIRFQLPRTSPVELVIYDARGRKVAEPVQGVLPSGFYRYLWTPASLPGGVYFVRMEAGSFQANRRVILLP